MGDSYWLNAIEVSTPQHCNLTGKSGRSMCSLHSTHEQHILVVDSSYSLYSRIAASLQCLDDLGLMRDCSVQLRDLLSLHQSFLLCHLQLLIEDLQYASHPKPISGSSCSAADRAWHRHQPLILRRTWIEPTRFASNAATSSERICSTSSATRGLV